MKLLLLLLMAAVVAGSQKTLTHNQKKEVYRLLDIVRKANGIHEKKREQAASSSLLDKLTDDVDAHKEGDFEEKALQKLTNINSGVEGLMAAPLMSKIIDTLDSLDSVCDHVMMFLHSNLKNHKDTTVDPHQGMVHPEKTTDHPPSEFAWRPEHSRPQHKPSPSPVSYTDLPTGQDSTPSPAGDSIQAHAEESESPQLANKRALIKALLRVLKTVRNEGQTTVDPHQGMTHPETTVDPHQGMTHPEVTTNHPPSEFSWKPDHKQAEYKPSPSPVTYPEPPKDWKPIHAHARESHALVDDHDAHEDVLGSTHTYYGNKRALLKELLRVLSQQTVENESKRRRRRNAWWGVDWMLIGDVCKAYQDSRYGDDF